jgi:hypothetical protein
MGEGGEVREAAREVRERESGFRSRACTLKPKDAAPRASTPVPHPRTRTLQEGGREEAWDLSKRVPRIEPGHITVPKGSAKRKEGEGRNDEQKNVSYCAMQ